MDDSNSHAAAAAGGGHPDVPNLNLPGEDDEGYEAELPPEPTPRKDFKLPVVITKFFAFERVGDFFRLPKAPGVPPLAIYEVGMNPVELEEYSQSIADSYSRIFLKFKGWTSYTDKLSTRCFLVFEEAKYSLNDLVKFNDARRQPLTFE